MQSGLLLIILLFTSCTVSHTEDGIYEGILPASDCPGIYVLLAINGNKYELLEKHITRPGTFITYGNIETHYHSQSLLLDNRMQLTPSGNGKMLQCQAITLRRISPQKGLPEICISQLFKENQTGENATLRIYSRRGKQYADFYFNNQEYTLEKSWENNSTEEYIKPQSDIRLRLQSQTTVSDKKLEFYNGKASYDFTLLTPTNTLYTLTGKKDNNAPSFLDVIYYTDEYRILVKLISTSPEYCYTLPQTEASAKTAIYTDGKTEWQLRNHQNATLIINNRRYEYKEQ